MAKKTTSSDHRGKTLKPSMRSLLKAIKGATKVTNHTLRHRIPRWWVYVNILTQLTIKKCILHIKLRDGPLPNRSYSNKSVNSGYMSNKSKSLIIIMTLLLLKSTSNETSFIAIKGTIRASINLIDPLTSDQMNTWRIVYKIPRTSPLKSSNLLSHRMLPFRMKNSIAIRSWLRKKSVKSVKLIIEVLNYSVTLLKKLLLMNNSKIGRLSTRLILLIKKRSHLMSPLKLHNISSKTIHHTICQKQASMSILIKSNHVCMKLRLVRSHTIHIRHGISLVRKFQGRRLHMCRRM
jgi:hypothetical protein